MTTRVIVALIILSCLLVPPAEAAPENVSWDDLSPPDLDLRHLDILSQRQKRDFLRVFSVQHRKVSGDETLSSDDIRMAADLRRKLVGLGVPVENLLLQTQQAEQMRADEAKRHAKSLAGKEIRLLGYALPLSESGGPVSLFLLVPYVGACIHVPAPPPDQTVRIEMKEEFVPKARFDPVLITGRLSVTPTISELDLVDGSAGIPSDYVLSATKIERATFRQMSQLSIRANEEQLKLQKPNWPVSIPAASNFVSRQ